MPILNRYLLVYIVHMQTQKRLGYLDKGDTRGVSLRAVERVLLVVNRASATGHGDTTIENLCAMLDETLNHGTEIQVEVVDNHPQVREE